MFDIQSEISRQEGRASASGKKRHHGVTWSHMEPHGHDCLPCPCMSMQLHRLHAAANSLMRYPGAQQEMFKVKGKQKKRKEEVKHDK
jgi:hypothetical protein